MITTEREFSKACRERGFSRLSPRLYVRVYGDGLYQTICTGHKKYMDPWSPYYSSTQRKSYRITIGIHSMYCEWPEYFFQPGKLGGSYSPREILERKREKGPFQGIWPEYELMETGGLDALDNIRTQEDMVALHEAVKQVQGGDRVHDLSLTYSYFLMGNLKEAEIEISRHFIQSSDALRVNRAWMERNGFEWDPDYEKRINMSLDRDIRFWSLCMSRDTAGMEAVLDENYRRNMEMAQRSGIAVHENHSQRHMPPLK